MQDTVKRLEIRIFEITHTFSKIETIFFSFESVSPISIKNKASNRTTSYRLYFYSSLLCVSFYVQTYGPLRVRQTVKLWSFIALNKHSCSWRSKLSSLFTMWKLSNGALAFANRFITSKKWLQSITSISSFLSEMNGVSPFLSPFHSIYCRCLRPECIRIHYIHTLLWTIPLIKYSSQQRVAFQSNQVRFNIHGDDMFQAIDGSNIFSVAYSHMSDQQTSKSSSLRQYISKCRQKFCVKKSEKINFNHFDSKNGVHIVT